jgi:hypothetical protein
MGSEDDNLKKGKKKERIPCPCCYNEDLPLGLFSRQVIADEPIVFTIMANHDEDDDIIFLTPYLAKSFERYFLKVVCPLPLGRINSPIIPQIWLEINLDEAETILHLDTFPQERGTINSINGVGKLANDLPGFFGSLGSYAYFYKQQGSPAVVTDCLDSRIQTIPENLDHQGMVDLYRQIWGNIDMVTEANLQQRADINSYWRKLVGAPVYRQPVMPPPMLSGIKPTEILVAPPQDTNDEVFLATIGCSETLDDHKVEIIAFARNPSEEFIQSFSEFSYLSRINHDPVESGMMIRERFSVPDSDQQMHGWLLQSPSWRYPKEKLAFKDKQGQEIHVLEAIPLHGFEIMFAETFGIEALLDHLQDDDVDLADLKRPPAVPLPDNISEDDSEE